MAALMTAFSPATRAWFEESFTAPTEIQNEAWQAIAAGDHALMVAPTGSGKTLAAFLWAIDRLLTHEREPSGTAGVRVLYLSPLKALGVDVERNLAAPMNGIARTANRLGIPLPELTVGVRSGDTPAAERRALIKQPPDILITTPESLFLMLTSSARDTLRTVDTVIVDEIHAIAGSKRGAHLALSLERLNELLARPAQRIGLSATVRPLDEVARFLGGAAPVTIVAPPAVKHFDLAVRTPLEDMSDVAAEGGSVWPQVEEAITREVMAHRSTIVFANSRRLAERLTARLNESYAELTGAPPLLEATPTRPPADLIAASGASGGAAPLLARSHHGSVSHAERAAIEADLKAGVLRCVVATSSLELGIDMGAVDLVIQVEAPPSVASGLQRIGRAGHNVGDVSRGILFPKHRADLLHCAVTVERMLHGDIEELAIPANPIDVLAQHTISAAAMGTLQLEQWFDLVRRAAPFIGLPRSAYLAVLDLLAGRYPSDQFAELRPRLIWDRDADTLTGRPGAARLAVTSGGTIPDRGLFGVFMAGDAGTGRRVGELDEEMVYESRVGDVFALGATSWRIQEISHDRVIVTPAFGQPGRLPFWKGDGIGRPAELGRALGEFTRQLSAASDEEARSRCRAAGLDDSAISNLRSFLDDQRAATGTVPHDRALLLERFHDELGDWRIVLHSPYGMPVHAPWALAVSARIRERYAVDAHAVASDDGIVIRLPETDAEPPGAELFLFDPDELVDIVTTEIGGSALFASRFRECAARALILPRYRPDRRSPLWQQRQRASQLLEVARNYPDFPIILEAMRECLHDVYDLPALLSVATEIAQRRIRVLETVTETTSPFAASLLFGYVGAFMYEGDAPLAERRAAALSVDSAMLAELLGTVELREVLDADQLAAMQAELQRVASERRARNPEQLADLFRELGPLTRPELEERTDELNVDASITELQKENRVCRVSFAGNHWYVAVEDVGRLRDALGVPVPPGIPAVFAESVTDPLGDLVSRYARSHTPFPAVALAERFGLGSAVAVAALRRLAGERRIVEGEFRPGEGGTEWCDAEVLRRLRRRSLAALRREVEPVSHEHYARFLPEWQHVHSARNGAGLTGVDGVAAVIEQLDGARIPASAWESLVLPTRVRDYRPAMLDELTASGDVLWAGSGSLPGGDGWVSFHIADTAPLTLTPATAELDSLETATLATLSAGGGFFFRQLSDQLGSTDDAALLAALWNLVWAGLITNDTLAPMRALLSGGRAVTSNAGSAPRRSGRPGSARPYRGTRSGARLPSRSGPPVAAGRWAALPTAETDPTRRAHALAETLLERYGIVTRGSVTAEQVTGGFALVYRTLARFEESGRVRRGYFIDGLGAAQFASGNAVDRLRLAAPPDSPSVAPPGTVSADAPHPGIVLAATDPANPFGAALPWPDVVAVPDRTGHRPGRKAGALIVMIAGAATIYLERGGRTALAFTDDEQLLEAAAAALAELISSGRMDRIRIETLAGEFIIGTPLGKALEKAGFRATPRGLRAGR